MQAGDFYDPLIDWKLIAIPVNMRVNVDEWYDSQGQASEATNAAYWRLADVMPEILNNVKQLMLEQSEPSTCQA